MIHISLIDIKKLIIYDRFIILGYLISLINNHNIIYSTINGSIIGITIYLISLCTSKIVHKEVMGGGDIKLYFMLSTYFSLYEDLLCVLISCVLALIYMIISKQNKKMVPFAPFICLAYLLNIITKLFFL